MEALPDGIFATFSGPDPAPTLRHPGQTAVHGGGQAEDPLAHLRADPGADRGLRRSPDARTLLIGAAGVLVVGLIALLAVITSGGTGTTANRPSGTNGATSAPKASAAATALSFGGSAPEGLTRLRSGAAASLLATAGVAGAGSVHDAWTWKDNNGSNLVVTLIRPAGQRHRSLQVIQLARLETSKPSTLRVMSDPNLPACRQGGVAGFTKNGLLVRDLDRNGVAEVAVGWSSRCSTAKPSEVRLALITDGEKYIVRGRGIIGGSSGTAVPEPKAAQWPAGYLNALNAVFHQLYY